MPSQTKLNKLYRKYNEQFNVSEANFLRETESPGVFVYANRIEFRYKEIISHYSGDDIEDDDENEKSYSIISRNVKFMATNLFHDENDYYNDEIFYYTNLIYPHTGSRTETVGKQKLRSVCLGDNISVIDSLIRQFRLVDCSYYVEDVFSNISRDTYWEPESEERSDNMRYKGCKFCSCPILITKDKPIACIYCLQRISTHQKLKSVDPKLINLCKFCGSFYNKADKCPQCK